MGVNMLTCFDVADYFKTLVDEESGDLMTNLKLQKLVYYAQGFYLALHEEPLFNEEIEAWTHGPVIPELYHYYKDHGAKGIPKPDNFDISIYPDHVKDLLNDIYDVYGKYSAWKLRDMTHEEEPWKNNYQKGDSIIPLEDMRIYFKTLLIND